MSIMKKLSFCAAALIIGSTAFAGNSSTYFAGQDCESKPAVPKEIPFTEGTTPPKPCKGNFWTLITKPAVFKVECEKVKISDETFYMKPIPPKYQWVEEQVQVAPARKIPYCQPAKFRRKCIEVVIQEASTKFISVPATYVEEEKVITFRPKMQKEIFIPAVYKTVMKTIEVEPAREALCEVATPTNVKLNSGESVSGSIGAISKPARCITIAVQELCKPAQTKKVDVPAITKTICVKKLKTPASVKEVVVPAVKKKIWVETCVGEECIKYREVPAEYKPIRRMVMKEKGSKERVEVPAKFQTVRRNILVSPSKMLWRQYSIGKCKAVADICSKYGSLPGSGAF